MDGWRGKLNVDPVEALLCSGNDAIRYFTLRDLCGEDAGHVERLWQLREPLSVIKKQLTDGSWKYPGSIAHHVHGEDFYQLETFRQAGILVEKYGFNNGHPAIERAADFLFSRQTEEGDFRGITGCQYAPHYTAGIMEILIKAGYARDRRIERGFQWLLSMRQDDGGWASPMRTRNVGYHEACASEAPVQPDKAKPFSHMLTGVALRPFAADPSYRKSPDAELAGRLLVSRFFLPDKYVDRRDKKYWEAVSYPFWFTDVISALDSLGRLGFTADDPHIGKAIEWLVEKQRKDGLFDLKMLKTKDKDLKYWVGLAACRALKQVS